MYSSETKLITLNWKIQVTYIQHVQLTVASVKHAIKKVTWNTSFLTGKHWYEIESIILGQIGLKIEISVTDSLFGFSYKRNKVKVMYVKHPLFKNELYLRNWDIY